MLGPDARTEVASRPALPTENVDNFPDALPDGTDLGHAGPYGPASGPHAGATGYARRSDQGAQVRVAFRAVLGKRQCGTRLFRTSEDPDLGCGDLSPL